MTEIRSMELRLKQAARKKGMELDPQRSLSSLVACRGSTMNLMMFFVHADATIFSCKGPCLTKARKLLPQHVQEKAFNEKLRGLAVRLCTDFISLLSVCQKIGSIPTFLFGNLANLSFSFISHFSHFARFIFRSLSMLGAKPLQVPWQLLRWGNWVFPVNGGHERVAPSKLSCENWFRLL